MFVNLLLLYFCNLQAQSYSESQKHILEFGKDTTIIIVSPIIPGSLDINHPCVNDISTTIYNDRLRINSSGSSCSKQEQIELRFRIISDVTQKFCLIDSNHIIHNDKVIPIASDYGNINSDNGKIIQNNKLKYDGSFARGLTAGNNQDLVLNSSFNMSLSGELRGGLSIKGIISDDNIPIQAQGNTQQLQEFDKVYLEVSKEKTFLRAGDYVLQKTESYFTKYYKKLQGASVGHSLRSGNNQIEGQVSYAVSRGQFARQNLETQEGNQGPYKLTGANGERFLIVLSGTEKVYADGILLTRGFQNDYIIDYNTAEIEFTINYIINKDSRIIIEYEYTDQNYLRTLYAGTAEISNEKWNLGIDVYSEQDSRNVTGFLQLDSTQLSILAESGDDIENTILPSTFIPDGTSTDIVWYVWETDTIIPQDSFLRYVPEFENGAVSAVFSEVPDGTGDYIIDELVGLNDRVYRYVGRNMGRYNPEVRLIPPRQRQIATLNGGYNISEIVKVGTEFSISNNDLNRFSEIDSEDDTGFGLMVFWEQDKLNLKESEWELRSSIVSEYKEQNFSALNPYRDVEFQRIWSLESTTGKYNELLTKSEIGVQNKFWNITLGHNHFSQFDNYSGNQLNNNISFRKNDWEFVLDNNLLLAKDSINDIQYYIPKLSIYKKPISNPWGYGINMFMESNEVNELEEDKLRDRSFRFLQSDIFLERKVTEQLDARINYLKRIDDRVQNGIFSKANHVDEVGLTLAWDIPNTNQLQLKGIYREVHVSNDLISVEEPKQTIYARIENNLQFLNKGIRSETLIETGSGQEEKSEFKYLEVQQGEGSYIWVDYNEDEIEQINEFEIAPFADQGNYERFTVFNNEFVRTTKNEFVQVINIQANKFIKPTKKVSKYLSKLSSRSRIKLSEKFEDDGQGSLAFLNWSLTDTTLVSYTYNNEHSLFYDLGSSVFDAQLSYRELRNRIIFITGFEERQSLVYQARLRWNIKNNIDFILESEFGEKNNISENFEIKNYQIDYYQFNPQVNWRISSNVRYTLKYRFENQRNNQGTETAISNDFGTELIWRNALKSSLNVSANYVNHNFNGQSGTPVELEMLDGLRKGNNFLWQLNYTQRINKQIDATLIYSGRKSESSNTVHTFSGQMKLLF